MSTTIICLLVNSNSKNLDSEGGIVRFYGEKEIADSTSPLRYENVPTNVGSCTVPIEVFRPKFLQASANNKIAVKVQDLVKFRKKPGKNVPVISLDRNVPDGQW